MPTTPTAVTAANISIAHTSTHEDISNPEECLPADAAAKESIFERPSSKRLRPMGPMEDGISEEFVAQILVNLKSTISSLQETPGYALASNPLAGDPPHVENSPLSLSLDPTPLTSMTEANPTYGQATLFPTQPSSAGTGWTGYVTLDPVYWHTTLLSPVHPWLLPTPPSSAGTGWTGYVTADPTYGQATASPLPTLPSNCFSSLSAAPLSKPPSYSDALPTTRALSGALASLYKGSHGSHNGARARRAEQFMAEPIFGYLKNILKANPSPRAGSISQQLDALHRELSLSNPKPNYRKLPNPWVKMIQDHKCYWEMDLKALPDVVEKAFPCNGALVSKIRTKLSSIGTTTIGCGTFLNLLSDSIDDYLSSSDLEAPKPRPQTPNALSPIPTTLYQEPFIPVVYTHPSLFFPVQPPLFPTQPSSTDTGWAGRLTNERAQGQQPARSL